MNPCMLVGRADSGPHCLSDMFGYCELNARSMRNVFLAALRTRGMDDVK